MEPRLTDNLRVVFTFMILISTGLAENDREFCGTWRHGQGPLGLNLNLSTGCGNISISADRSVLSIDGQITAHCTRSEVIALKEIGVDSKEDIKFCLYWAPLLDQLMLQIGGKNLTLCWPASLQGSCCRYLDNGPKTPEAPYGIKDGIIKTDFTSDKILTGYTLIGDPQDCKSLCDQQIQRSTQVDMTEAMLWDARQMELHCPRRYDVDMEKVSRGYDVTLATSKGVPAESATTIHLPPALQQAAKDTSTVVCTFFTNNSLFQEGLKKVRVLDNVVAIDVVGSDVENEVIANLSEPVKIGFHHDVIPKKHSRKCVSWDTRKDPLQVNWLADGCETRQKGDDHTECLCNHLTYFTVLVQMEPRPVRHLLALTAITSLGCAVSVISCIALIIYLCMKSRRCKEQSIPIHLGLAVSLAFLNLLFFFTGVLANVGGESLCVWVAAGLHYALLSSLTWMGIEVFHTFWLVYMVFTPSLKSYLLNVIGFALPAVPVVILAAVGDIYGLRKVAPSDDLHNPYLMCWMKDSNEALLAHKCTNIPLVGIVVCSGVVMLFLVYRQIRFRDEWKQNRVAFLSIWGLSCLFGTTWGLTFLDFGPLSDFALFLFCILNSFQGFLLMLRFYMLDWMRKQAGGSALGSSSTGSTRQHMLKAPEKS